MTDAEALAKATDHYPATNYAYYDGRAAGEWGGKCEFTRADLIAAWKRGVRSIRAEIRLDNDMGWEA